MELKRIFLLAALLAVLTGTTVAQQPAVTLPPASVKIQSLGVENVKSDRIEMVARLGLYPERNFRSRQLSFFSMRINEIPVYVASISGDFQLKKGELLMLPDLHITAYYRDLSSLDPVRKIVQEQKATVTGEIAADLDATLIEKIALHSLHPRVMVSFSKEITVAVPGGAMGSAAALAALEMAGTAGPLATTLMGAVAPGKDAAWRNRLANEETRHLVAIRTQATLSDLDGAKYPLDYIQLGFWLAPGVVVAPSEAVRPWEFDIDASARLAAGATIDKKSIEISVTPLAPATGQTAVWSLKAKDFKVVYEGSPEKAHVVADAKSPMSQIRQRASAENYALLRFREGIAGDPVKAANPAAQNWERLGVLRLQRPIAAENPKTEVVMLPGNLETKQIHLAQPIDDSAFGSPLYAEDGAVGMVVDENFAVLITGIKHLEN